MSFCTVCQQETDHTYHRCPQAGRGASEASPESLAAARRLLQECGLTKARVLAAFAPCPAMPRLCDCDVQVTKAWPKTSDV